MTLSFQTAALGMMAGWVGGADVNRDRKGDPNGRAPVSVIPVEKQRAALKFLLENAFQDEAFGLTPDLLARMTVDKWLDGDGARSALSSEPTWPVHDRIMGIQSSTLTMLMNPTTLRRVYDNEFRTPSDQDALTLPELIDSVEASIWTELDKPGDGPYTARKPMISSFRRNLQREYLERLIDLTLPSNGSTPASKTIANLAQSHLRDLSGRIEKALEAGKDKVDPYSRAHLAEAKVLIDRALSAELIYNIDALAPGLGGPMILIGQPQAGASAPGAPQP
jgi:hypothetical protein